MAKLDLFSTPGHLEEPSAADRQAWSDDVASIFATSTASFSQIYDPTVSDTPADARVVEIGWNAFPARLLESATSDRQRWRQADDFREEQDEYCEWSVERDGKEIKSVTFSSEVPEYWEHVAQQSPDRLVALYHDLIGPEVPENELFIDETYQVGNIWNTSTEGPIAHMVQESNTLGAAVSLVAVATIPRERDGEPAITKEALANCAGLGNPFRNSDPQIAVIVNGAARAGDEITLEDPIGLYISGLQTTGMVTPDGADPASFWTVERGDSDHILRARYEVPSERGYSVSEIKANGRSIDFGAQLADRVGVRITALVKDAAHEPQMQPCDER